MSGHETAVDRLRSQGYRMTPQRLTVLEIVAGHPGHIGVDLVWSLAKEQHPYVGLGHGVPHVADAETGWRGDRGIDWPQTPF